MKNKWLNIILASLLLLTSCIGSREGGKDYYLWESYQIANTSSVEMTLSFYSNGTPKTVYVERYNQSDPVFVSKENAVKPLSELMEVMEISLQQGQSVLFYEPILSEDKSATPQATCLIDCGYGSSFFNIYRAAINIIGENVRISGVGQEIMISMTNHGIWETWYDETEFIYSHVWQIE